MSEPGKDQKPDEGASQEPAGTQAPAIDELEEMRRKMDEMSQQLKESNTRLNDPSYIEYLAQKAMGSGGQPSRTPQPAGTPAAPQEGIKLPEDFDSIKPEEFLQTVRQIVAYDVLPQIGQVAQSVARMQAEVEIERVAQKYEDFNEYVPMMQKIVEGNPALTPEQAYFLAKSAGKPASTEPKQKVVPLAEKIAAELRGSGAVPGGAVPTKEKMAHPTIESVADKVFDKVFGNKE